MSWGLVDFNLVFLPAARRVLAGIDPYSADPGLFSPPWVLYPIYLLAPLPDAIATLLWLLIIVGALLASLYCTATIFHIPTGGKRSLLPLILVLPPYSLQTLFARQLTPLVMLGVVTVFAWDNPFVSLPLLSLKPQLGVLPAVILMVRLIKGGECQRLLGSMALDGSLIGASFLIVPNSFSHFSAEILRGGFLRHNPHWITTLPRALSELGLDRAHIWPIYVTMAVALVALLVVRRDLPMVILCSLLVPPYAREYDYVLLTMPAFCLLHRGIARPVAWLSLLWPLHRFIVGDLFWSWLSIFVPVIFLVFLIYEKREKTVPFI